MDYYRIIHQPGYRREDLKEEDRRVLSYLDDLADEVLAVDPVEIDEEADAGLTTIGNIKREIMLNAFHEMHEILKLKIAEIQIGMAESGEYGAIARDELPLCENNDRGGGDGGGYIYAENGPTSQIFADQHVFTRPVNVVAKGCAPGTEKDKLLEGADGRESEEKENGGTRCAPGTEKDKLLEGADGRETEKSEKTEKTEKTEKEGEEK